jgi:hypothetical protein
MDALLLLSGTCFHLRREWKKMLYAETASVVTVLVILERAVDLTVVFVAFLRTLLVGLVRSTSFLFEDLETVVIAHELGPAAAAVAGSSVAGPYTAESSPHSYLRGCLRRFQQRSSERGVAEHRLASTPEASIAQFCVARVSAPLA